MIKKYIIGLLFFILIAFSVRLSIKCSKLETENFKLKSNTDFIIDSLNVENKILEDEIIILCEDLEYYKYKVDSLKKIKRKVIVKTEYVVSENLTESLQILKDNLK